MARHQPTLNAADLGRLFGRTWHYAKARYDGKISYKFDELMTICEWLDIELADLYHPQAEAAAQQVRDAS